MKRCALCLLLAACMMLTACTAQTSSRKTSYEPEVWPVAGNSAVPPGTQSWLDEVRMDYDQAAEDAFVVDDRQDMAFALSYAWLRVRDRKTPAALKLALRGSSTDCTITSSAGAPSYTKPASGTDGGAADVAALKAQGDEGFDAFTRDEGEGAVPIGDAVVLPVGAYSGYAAPYRRGNRYGAWLMWGTQRRTYHAVLNAPAAEFAFAYQAIATALSGFESLSEIEADAQEIPPIPVLATTSGLLVGYENYQYPQSVVQWYADFNARDGTAADMRPKWVYVDRHNDMTMIVPMTFSEFSTESYFEDPRPEQIYAFYQCDEGGDTSLSISSYKSGSNFVWRDKRGAVAFDGQALWEDARHEWNLYIQHMNARLAPYAPYPIEAVGEVVYIRIGEYTGVGVPFRLAGGESRNGLFITWNTEDRQYTCTLIGSDEFYDPASIDTVSMLETYDGYVGTKGVEAYLEKHGY
jgi:hypothetical protein